jgi:Holliday junction resolvasome RuvABC ATP-dependent DNA helicase subunit
MAGNQNMTLRVRPELLKKLRDYAYTERITLTEATNKALEDFLLDKKGLLEKPR